MELVPVSSASRKSPVVTHSNQLTEARYSLTVAEQRLVLTLLSFISPEDEDFKEYEIRVLDFKTMLDIHTNAVYEQFRDTLKKLASRVIYIPMGKDGKDYLIANWFSSAEYDSSRNSVKISFDKKLKPYLLQLKEQFTKYRLFVVAQFKSAYTIRIYMLLKQYETIGYREFDIVEFREILGIEPEKYPQFKALRQWVLNQAKKEFETKNHEAGGFQSDITFDLETIRTGRKITRIRFNIKKQSYQERLPLDLPEASPSGMEATPACEALARYGIKGDIAGRYLEQQEEAEILRCVALLEEAKAKGKVKSSESGYLLKLLEARAGQETEAQKQEREAQQQKTAKRQQAKKQQDEEQRKSDLTTAFNTQVVAEYLSHLNPQEKTELLKEIQKDYHTSTLEGGIARTAIIALEKIPDYHARKTAYLAENLG